MSLPNLRDVFESDSDSDCERQNSPDDRKPDAIQNIKSIIDKQDKLISLGLRLNRFNDPEDTQRALSELDGLLDKETNGGEQEQNESILLGVPRIGRATCINGQVHHCDPVDGECRHHLLEQGEYSLIDGHVVFLSKFRRAIIASELSFVSWEEADTRTEENVATNTSR